MIQNDKNFNYKVLDLIELYNFDIGVFIPTYVRHSNTAD
jgi:hypothetical protein